MSLSNAQNQTSMSQGAAAADAKEQQAPASTSVGVVSSTSSPQRPHHRIQLGDVTTNNLGQLKALNLVLFPVNYSQKFYDDVLQVGEFAKLAYFNDVCVGAVCCRKDPIPNVSPEQMRLYIMTLGVLAPYRHYGVGTELLKHILYHATTAAQHGQRFVEAYLHVQTSNDEALAFYRKHGFDICETAENYYKRISPADAYVLRKKLT